MTIINIIQNSQKPCLLSILRHRVTTGIFSLLTAVLTLTTLSASAEDTFLPLAGDGKTDDTAAIQARLDSGEMVIHLPPPSVSYLISDTLRIHSGQTLRLDPQTTIRLADHADKHLISNADYEGGDKNITVEGGIWDGNNPTQMCRYHDPNYDHKPYPFSSGEYLGVLMQFKNVRNLTLRNLTLKDPEAYGIQLGIVDGFLVENILFDYNLKEGNMDGVHLNGGCHRGRIVNLRGNTNDDMVALNADDWGMYEMSRGEISDISIDGLWATNGYTAVRILSAGDPVRRVRISNVFGSWRFYIVSFTHHNVSPGERLIEDVLIDGVFTAKQLDRVCDISEEMFWLYHRRNQPIFFIESGMNINDLTIQNVTRREYMSNAAPMMTVGADAVLQSVTIRDVTQVNYASEDLRFLVNDGTIRGLFWDHVRFRSGPDGGANIPLIDKGTIEWDNASEKPETPKSAE